eukprot:11613595-Alexandrium_andersonii.AAC.1
MVGPLRVQSGGQHGPTRCGRQAGRGPRLARSVRIQVALQVSGQGGCEESARSGRACGDGAARVPFEPRAGCRLSGLGPVGWPVVWRRRGAEGSARHRTG